MTDVLTFSGVILIIYLSVIVGRLLFFIAPEEIEPGRKWLKPLSALLFFALFFFSIESSTIRYSLSIVMLMLPFIAPERFLRDKIMSRMSIAMLGIVIGMMTLFSEDVVLTASLSFLSMAVFSGLMFYPLKRDVDVRKSYVKHKRRYIREVALPFLTVFFSILLFLII